MTDLKIERTDKTPEITAKANGIIDINGISIPENAMGFYEPLKNWMDEYSENLANETVCNVFLAYFNTSTANIILNFFKRLGKLESESHKVVINWHYEKNDIDMEESGHDYKTLLRGTFNMIKVE